MFLGFVFLWSMASVPFAFAVDGTAPVVGTASPLTATVGTSALFSVTYSDTVGVTSCTLYAEKGATALNSGMTLGSATSGTATASLAFTIAGTYTTYAMCSDAGGNNGIGASVSVVVSAASTDTTAPTVGTPSPTTATAGTAVTISVSYSDAVGVASCSLAVDGDIQTGSMTLGASATSGTATKSYTPSAAGTSTVLIACVDAAGNAGQSTATSLVVASAADTTAPTVGSVSPSSATAGTAVSFSVSAGDDALSSCSLYVGGVNQGIMTVDSSTPTSSRSYTFSSAGTYSVYATCVDESGNVGTGATTSVIVASSDITTPTVGSVTPLTATIGVAKTFSATYADAVGVSSCALYVSGASVGAMTLGASATTGTATYSYTASASGSVSIQAKCTDAAGNVGSGTSKTLVVAGDTTAPTVGTVSPTTATVGTAVTFAATVSDNVAVTGCTLYVGGVSQGAMTISGGSASKQYTFSTSGSSAAKATCVDAAGNSGSGTPVTVTVSAASAADTTAPTVGSLTPTTATVGVGTSFSAGYSDAVGVVSCAAYIDGAASAMALASGLASITETFTTSGSHTMYMTCLDAAGNIGTGSTTTVTVAAASTDSTGPTVGTVSPTTATQNTATTLSVMVTDASAIAECRLYVGGSDQGPMTALSSTYSRSYTSASSGTIAAYAVCNDTAGNSTTGTSATITFAAAVSTAADSVAPTVGAITPTTAVVGTALTLSASVADSGGMGTCTLYVNSSNMGSMTVSGGYATYLYTFTGAGSAAANAYCVDAAGNATRGATSTVSITTTETTSEESEAVGEAAENTLIKLACGSTADVSDPCHAVYYFDGYRHAFPNEKVFFTWYEDFDDVIVVTDDFMASVTLGLNVTYHPGTRMVKFITVRTVYAVGSDGELRAIASEDVAASIWGSDWNTQIDDISDAFYGNYTFGEAIDSTSDFDPDAVESATTNIAEMFPE